MAAVPPGTRVRCNLCQVDIQGMAGGKDLVHFSQGAPASRAKLWARVCQFLRSDDQISRCINQDPSLRGEVQSSDYYAEPPAVELGAPTTGGPNSPGGPF